MAITYFNVTGNYVATAPGQVLSGSVVFTPIFYGGDTAKAVTLHKGLFPSPVPGRIVGGILYDTDGNTLQLTANTSDWALTSPLYYQVDFTNVKATTFHPTMPNIMADQRFVEIASFAFLASADATPVDLVTVSPAPGVLHANGTSPFAQQFLVSAVDQASAQAYLGGTATKASVGLGSADNTSDANKPVSTAQQTALDGKKPIEAGTFPWPQGLVGLWDFAHDAGNTVTSRVGSQITTLTALASKTVVKDGADPGPFGPSLVLDGATVFVKSDNLGALDVSTTGDQVTLVSWVKDSANNHDDTFTGGACRAGSHCEPGDAPARQYGSYFDISGAIWSCARFTPHIGAQDGPTPGYPYNFDMAATARKLFTGTGQSQWHMEAFTFDGSQITAYVDGITDTLSNVSEVPPYSGYSLSRVTNRNPYPLKKGINRSQSVKRFAIGGSTQSVSGVVNGVNYTTGKLGGVAVFNRALSAAEIMGIRLATLLSGEAITMYSFEVSSTGAYNLNEIGWAAGGGAANVHVGSLTSTGPEYAITRPAGGTKAYLQKTSTTIGAAWGPVTGLNSSQIRRIRFKMLSAAVTAAAQRLLVKVGSQWWASNTTYATTGAHASDTDWTGAETKTHSVNWDVGNWLPVTISDTGGTPPVYQNLAKNPALTSNATNWFKAGAAANATAARFDTGAGFVYRLTWTGTDAFSGGQGGGLNFVGVSAITAGTVYSGSMVVKPSKTQQMNLQLIWIDSGGATISTTDGPSVSVTANASTTLTVSGTAPAGATGVTLKAESTTGGVNWVSGDTLDLTRGLVATAPIPPAYFDGTSFGAVWDGTSGNSSSTETGAIYQNLARNPALTSNATNWFVSGAAAHATGARVSDGAGGFVWRLTWTGTDAGVITCGGLNYPGMSAVIAGNVYAASALVNSSKPSQKLQLELIWIDSGGTIISTTGGGVVAVGANNPTTVTVSGVAPTGATSATIRVKSTGASWISGDTLDITKILVVNGGLLPGYFDGTTTNAAWDSTPGNATSTETGVAIGALSVSGSTNAVWIDNALLTAVGFLSSGGDGSVVRVSDLELLPS